MATPAVAMALLAMAAAVHGQRYERFSDKSCFCSPQSTTQECDLREDESAELNTVFGLDDTSPQGCMDACDAASWCTAFSYTDGLWSDDCYLYSGDQVQQHPSSSDDDTDCYVRVDCLNHAQCGADEYCDTNRDCYACSWTRPNGDPGTCQSVNDAIDGVCPQHCSVAQPTPSPSPEAALPGTCDCASPDGGGCMDAAAGVLHERAVCTSQTTESDCDAVGGWQPTCNFTLANSPTTAPAEPTAAPTTSGPTTHAPTTSGPTTHAPTTSEPTHDPTNSEPTTSEPSVTSTPATAATTASAVTATSASSSASPVALQTPAPSVAPVEASPGMMSEAPTTAAAAAAAAAPSVTLSPTPSPTPAEPSVVCTYEYDPVCGTDGSTYTNRCVATSRYVAVASMGACSSELSGGNREESSDGSGLSLAAGLGLVVVGVAIIAGVAAWKRRARLQQLDGSPGTADGGGGYAAAVTLNPQYVPGEIGIGMVPGNPVHAKPDGPDGPVYAVPGPAAYTVPQAQATYVAPYDTVEIEMMYSANADIDSVTETAA